ncbi:hypothetical protein BDQ17DRAFT_1436416 [Cyathus striatus]|nr:hypothetical protein BDQ17DRAFT_1436416 [Cyathus striatus]
MQLWVIGRAASPDILESEGFSYVAPSPVSLSDRNEFISCELIPPEIQEYVTLYGEAALNASVVDGIEDVSNQRSDKCGGSIENRSRFGLEVVKAVVDVIGANRVGVRVSPWSTFQYMRMHNPPIHGSTESMERHSESDACFGNDTSSGSDDFLRAMWHPEQFIRAGGYIRESTLIRAEEKGDIIAFGRRFIANPDLVNRLYDRPTFFVPAEDPNAAVGYIDYPFAKKKVEMPVKACECSCSS